MTPAQQIQAVTVHTVDRVFTDTIAPASHRYVIECGCHNPDGYGVGRADFAGPSVADAFEQWYDHVIEEMER